MNGPALAGGRSMKRALKLAAEDGRRVGTVPKAKRIAAQPATDAARLRRQLSEIVSDSAAALNAAMQAEDVVKVMFAAVRGQDQVVTQALAREALIASGYATGLLSNMLDRLERASA